MSPIDSFFKLGEKVTKNDPKRLADWNFYMMCFIFIAFLSIFSGNLLEFLNTFKLSNFGWMIFSIAILWFQYFALKATYDNKKLFGKPLEPIKSESENEINELFNEKNFKKCEFCDKQVEDRDICQECIDKQLNQVILNGKNKM